MKRSIKAGAFAWLSLMLICTGGCSSSAPEAQRPPAATPETVRGAASGEASPLSPLNAAVAGEQSIPIAHFDGNAYIPGNELAKLLNFNSRWEPSEKVLQMGDNDATYEWKVDSSEVVKDDNKVRVSMPPILRNSMVYLPVAALSLMNDDMNYRVTDNEIIITSASAAVTGSVNDPEEPNTGSELDFEDDPADPFKGQNAGGESAMPTSVGMTDFDLLSLQDEVQGEGDYQQFPAAPAAVRNIDMNSVISKAKGYLGVQYLFGAPPYPQSGKFDCSTFTKYIFGRHGVNLSRTARAQANQGTTVSRKNLRKGDLMFFYVPGRFRTNRTVGHVGIYMGNSKMIHSSPKPENGVQITSINKPYWKQTFLRAQRVAY